MRLHGLIVPLVTPMTATCTLDHGAVDRLLAHIGAGGADAAFLLGTTGEALSLPLATRCQLIDRAAGCACGLPLLVGVTDTCMENSVLLARRAADAGAAAVVATPPCYYPLNEGELLDYFLALVRQSPLPVVLYNIPQTARMVLSPPVVQRLAEEPKVVGLKDSSGDMGSFLETMRRVEHRDDFAMLIGDEAKLAEALSAGADGGVCGTANAAPRVFRNLIDAAAGQDGPALAMGRRQVDDLRRLYAVDDAWSRFVTHIKMVLEHMGLCRRFVAPPLRPPLSQTAQAIARLFDSWTRDGYLTIRQGARAVGAAAE